MGSYEEFENYLDLVEKVMGDIALSNDYALYNTDKFIEIGKKLAELKKNIKDDNEATDLHNRTETYGRYDKINKLLEYAAITKNSLDAVDPNEGNTSEAAEKTKEAYAYMLKMKMIMADIKNNTGAKRISDAIDYEKMNKIFRESNQSAIDRFVGGSIYSTAQVLTGQRVVGTGIVDAKKINAAKQALKDGTLAQNIVVNVNSKASTGEYSGKVVTNPVDMVKELLKSDKIKETIKQYKNAEKYWYGSELTEVEEKHSRRAFMECYEEELRGLYKALNVSSRSGSEQYQKEIVKLLEEQGLTGMVRDYHDMIFDRAEESKTLAADSRAYDYLYARNIMTEAERDFRLIPTTSTLYNPDSAKDDSAQKLGLKEFHKWIYRNCDSKGLGAIGLGSLFGAHGSARAYMEDFMKAPYDQQIKTLYMIENKTRRREALPTEDEIKNYIPDMKKIKKEMVASKFKLWRRLNGKQHRWNKIKECMDRLTEVGGPSQKKSKILGEIVNTTKVTFNAASEANYIGKVSGKASPEFIKGAGAVMNTSLAVSNAIAIHNNLKKLREDKTLSDEEKKQIKSSIAISAAGETNALMNVIDFGRLAIKGELANSNAATIFGGITKHTVPAVWLINSAREANNIAKVQGRNDVYGKENDKLLAKTNYETMSDDKPEKELLRKIKMHGHAIKGINHRKVVNSAVEMTQGVVCTLGSVLGGAFGILSEASVVAAAGAATVVSGIGIAAVPIAILGKNSYERYGFRRTIDTELYENKEQKDAAINKLKKTIDRRIERISNKNGENKKLIESLDKLKNSRKEMLYHLRKNAVRKANCINEKQLRNVIVSKIGNDIRDMYYQGMQKDTQAEKQKINIIAKYGAKNLIDLAGGREPVTDGREEMNENEKKALDANNAKNTLRGL